MRKHLHKAYRSAQCRSFPALTLIGALMPVALILIAGMVFMLPRQNSRAATGLPYLERQELITNKCSMGNEGCGWSNMKSRIVRTSDDTVYVTYVSDGDGTFNGKVWHLIRRDANGTWQEIGNGSAGSEPASLLRSPNDDLNVVAFPSNASLQITRFTKTSNTFSSAETTIPGFGMSAWDAPYSGAGINTQGNIIIDQTSWGKANDHSQFASDIYWTYYTPSSNTWTYHDSKLDYSYRYLFVFPGEHNDLSFVGTRDEQRTKLGYPTPSSASWAILNAVKYYHSNNVNAQPMSDLLLKEEYPQSSDFIITDVTDTYVDTQGRTHILYLDTQDGGAHHAIIQNGVIIKDVLLPVPNYWWTRIIQDTTGRFYFISMDGGNLTVYPGASGDTDGTRLDPVVTISLGSLPYCLDGTSCQSPHLAIPRGGTPLADYVDGFYNAGSGEKLVYFRLRLRDAGLGMTPTPTLAPQPTPTSTLAPQPAPTSTSAPQPAPNTSLPSSTYSIYNGGLAPGWEQTGYQSSVTLTNSTPSFDGKPSIAWTANAWSTISLSNPVTANTSLYSYLHFVAQGSQTGQHYAVQLYDSSGQGLSAYLPLANYGGDPTPGTWKVYNIPLADLGATAKQVNGIQLQNTSDNGNQVLYLADISFLSSIAPAATSTPTLPVGPLIQNGGFEDGTNSWLQSSSDGHQLIDSTNPYTGQYSAHLCGYSSCDDSIKQHFTVPDKASNITITYWWYGQTSHTASTCRDTLGVALLDSKGKLIGRLQQACNTNVTRNWQQMSFDVTNLLAKYAGQTVTLVFKGKTTASSTTSAFFVDDVEVKAS